MKPFSIRSGTIDDAPALAGLMTQLGYRTSTAEMTARMVDILTKCHYFSFVAEKEGRVVGMVGGYIGPYFEKNATFARILAMVVDCACRNQKIGTALIETVENDLKKNGVAELLVNTRFERFAAHRFYERRGFRKTGFRLVKLIKNT